MSRSHHAPERCPFARRSNNNIPGGPNRERRRAITVVVAPVVYNALYDVARRPGNRLPVGAAWYLIALLGGLIPELLHRSMSTDEMVVA